MKKQGSAFSGVWALGFLVFQVFSGASARAEICAEHDPIFPASVALDGASTPLKYGDGTLQIDHIDCSSCTGGKCVAQIRFRSSTLVDNNTEKNTAKSPPSTLLINGVPESDPPSFPSFETIRPNVITGTVDFKNKNFCEALALRTDPSKYKGLIILHLSQSQNSPRKYEFEDYEVSSKGSCQDLISTDASVNPLLSSQVDMTDAKFVGPVSPPAALAPASQTQNQWDQQQLHGAGIDDH